MDSTSSNASYRDWTRLKRVGGGLCLDFVNTVDRETNGYVNEWLNDFADLVMWEQLAQILTTQQAKHLLAQAKLYPNHAQATFHQAIRLREVLYRIFSAFCADRSPQPEDLEQFNTMLTQTYTHSKLVFTGNGFAWSWTDCDHLEQVLWQVMRSATDLLTDPNLNRVRECAGTDCGWVFLDMSRNRSRRWCDMEECGNRAKARRHYERSKEF
ncbi:CGNR zinc finger domain-containing protein [Iningainema tapete]|nr:ABATE domain-containing protein [Iningainema tapete]